VLVPLVVLRARDVFPGRRDREVTQPDGVSVAVGAFFGVFPARRAARLDPVVTLRTE
jgi:hypothetical protein